MPTILLASASPRRREILQVLGHRVVLLPVRVDEDERGGEDPTTYLERIVDAKLEAALDAARVWPGSQPADAPSDAPADAPADAIVVADTTVALDGALLHKPTDAEDGRRMLRALASRAHVVTTRFAAIALSGATSGHRHAESVSTRVNFRAIDDDEVDAYVAIGEGADKAGGYAIQGRGGAFVARIEGSYGAVVGLPPCEVSIALRRLGVR